MSCITNDCGHSIWVLCDNGVDIWHLNQVIHGCEIVSGQPNIREFHDLEEALAVIPEQYRPEEDE